MLRRIVIYLILLFILTPLKAQQSASPFRVAFWNVENFFDAKDDPTTDDDEFTPQAMRHWTTRRFEAKRDALYKVIAAMKLPAVVGMAEVENDFVLMELVKGTPLRKMGYEFVHYDSPDHRGVDCALLYRSDLFKVIRSRPICVSDSLLHTRDILLVEGTTSLGDTLLLLVNHWPSKLGGNEAENNRLRIANILRLTIDSLHHQHPSALVVAMGDFNASPEEEPVSIGMGFGTSDTNAEGLRNLMVSMASEQCSYYYQGHWSCIDQFFVTGPRQRTASLQAQVFYEPFLLEQDSSRLIKRPFRTYQWMKYKGGYSDHLPIFFEF